MNAKKIFYKLMVVVAFAAAFIPAVSQAADIETGIVYHGYNEKQKEYFLIIDRGEDGGIRNGTVYQMMIGGQDIGEFRIQGLLDNSAVGVLERAAGVAAPEPGARVVLRDIASAEIVVSPLPADTGMNPYTTIGAIVTQGQTEPGSDKQYRLGPGDVLTINTWPVSILPESATIRPDGTVDLPYVGRVNANNITAFDLAQKLRERMIKDFKRPWVEVRVLEYRSRIVRLGGDLGALRTTPPPQPGGRLSSYEIPLKSIEIKLIDFIDSLGGLSVTADKSNLRIVRADGSSFTVDYEKIAKDPMSAENIVLADGDRLYFSTRTEIKKLRVMVLGKIQNQGVQELDPERTQLVEVLSLAGGPLVDARLNRVYVYRMYEKDGVPPKAFTFDFSGMAEGGLPPMFALAEGDVVFVPGRKSREVDKFNKVIGAVSPSVSLILMMDRLTNGN